MDISFSIRYRAQWGQRLCVCGSVPELGAWDENEAIELHSEGEDRWMGIRTIDGRRKDLAYYYLVKDDEGQVLRREWKRMHRLLVKEPFRTIYMDDHWINRPANAPFYSSSFYDVLFRHEEQLSKTVIHERRGEKLILQVYAPTVPTSKRLFVVGSMPQMGEWMTDNALEMLYMGKGQWYVSIATEREMKDEGGEIAFKFFIAERDRKGIRWEVCDNRTFSLPDKGLYDAIYVAGLTFEEGDYRPRFAGLVAPLFSLRHRTDYGVGDFASLRLAIDWVASAGMHVMQLLPIHDTTFYRDWRDSYPYNAISVDALHPIYVDLSALPPLRKGKRRQMLEARAEALRHSPTLLYPEVMALKEEYLWQHYREQGSKVMEKRDFLLFVQANEPWLYPYALYCLLRDLHPGKTPSEWVGYESYDKQIFLSFWEESTHRERLNYYIYTQYVLAQQLLELRSYAESREVLLKGDLPIGVAPHSIDTWLSPQLFHLDRSAGAPPDAFAVDGQNWGFPTYDWEAMYRDGMQWWRARFERMSAYFKAFRIDHILGFFRIWEIPRWQRSGLLGHFSPALPLSREFWEGQFCSLGAWEVLSYPAVHREDALKLFPKSLERLVEKGILIPIEGTPYLRLYTSRQENIAGLSIRRVPGGGATITLLMELAREIALVEDMSQAGYYHPRIGFEDTRLFARWRAEEQALWQQLSRHYYYEVHNELWKRTALRRLLPLLESTDMLVCAEDLGMIPATVPEVLDELQILSLELERMPKCYTETGWGKLSKLPYNAICTTSTHDMPPIKAWWQGLTLEEKQEYLNAQLPYTRLTPESPLSEICSAIVAAHVASPSMFAILPMQDWMSIDPQLSLLQAPEDEQINHPENPQQRWEWRMPLTLEEVMEQHGDWAVRIHSMLLPTSRE